MDTYNTGQVAAIYSVTTETVRAWAEEFEGYLSPTANPGVRRTRLFSSEDMEILALVGEMKQAGATFKDVHAALASGQRGSAPETLPDEVRAIMVSETERRLTVEINMLRQQLDAAMVQVEESREVREENIRLKSDLKHAAQRVAEMEARLTNREGSTDLRVKELLDDRAKLEREIGEAQGELKALMRMLKMRGAFPGDSIDTD
jgi:DNA-binding transcriptional MerR regulator